MSILTQGLRRLCRKAVDAVLPNSCLLCGADGADLLCTGCQADLPRLPYDRCPRCCEPTFEAQLCGRCLSEPPHFDAAVALYRYDFPLDRLVQGLKYGGQLALASWFGGLLAEALAGRHFDSIIPLPLHPSRLRERGFNQSGEIARVVGRRLGLAVDVHSCRRWHPNAPQAELPLSARAANVRGVFECVSDLSGRQVLVIDDVMTSGATLSECARTLKLHGAARVEVAVVARALRN